MSASDQTKRTGELASAGNPFLLASKRPAEARAVAAAFLWTAAVVCGVAGLATAQPASRPTVLPGLLDLPIVEGSSLMEPCTGWFVRGGGVLESPSARCVSIPAGVDPYPFQVAYTRGLERIGWRSASGAANTLWFEKTVGGDCLQRLDFTGVPQALNADGTDVDPKGGFVFIFAMNPEPVCKPGVATK